ncbi:hypothetical protein B0H16DRAFT_1805540 [Mycena metata]|uniref:Uncharacterized protein n=1 Tax=Mycena metata TaxID=1033252 RepID=A0AAD7H8Z6_9AGAR|nr:hypothetical protein B0H16DRAFT_1805540 [Mycena metata]
MPKASKSKKARQNNLSKATAALTLKRSQTSTPIPDDLAQISSGLDSPAQTFSELDVASLDDTLSSWDLLLGDELPDVECTELQENNADEEDMELNSAAAVDSFWEFLVNAQKTAEKAELFLEQEKEREEFTQDILGKLFGARKRLRKKPSESSTSNEITEISSDSESDSSADVVAEDSANIASPSPVIIDSSPAVETFMDPVNLAHVHLKKLLEAISNNSPPTDNSPESLAENALNQLTFRNFPALQHAANQLELETKKKEHDLNLKGMEAILPAEFETGCIHTFLQANFPCIKLVVIHLRFLDDEDFSLAIKLHLQAVAEKDGHFRANTIVDYVASTEMEAILEEKGVPLQERTISVWTAHRWLKTLDYRFGRRKNGMYVDGYERDDVVKYCMAFVKRWIEEYEPRIAKFNNDGVCIGLPGGTCPDGKPYRLIVATYDESTFFGNDRNKIGWIHASFKAKPEAKGQGQSIMVSNFLIPEWGRLVHGEKEAQLLSHAGKN